MKRFLWVLPLFLLAAQAPAQEPKLAFVDLQRALNESAAGKKARDEFKGQVDRLQASLKKKKDDMDALKDRIEKKALVMKEEERANLEEEYRRKARDFEREYKDSQADLQRKDSELTAVILKDLQEVLREIGERDGYTMIFEESSSAVLYGKKSIDLTDELLREYNRRKGK